MSLPHSQRAVVFCPHYHNREKRYNGFVTIKLKVRCKKKSPSTNKPADIPEVSQP